MMQKNMMIKTKGNGADGEGQIWKESELEASHVHGTMER